MANVILTTEIPFVINDETFKTWSERTNQMIQQQNNFVRLQELEMLGTHTYVQETIIDAYEKGFRIIEIPSIWKKRKVGKSKVVGSIPTYIFYTLPILIIRSKQHIKWLYSIGIILCSMAVIYFSLISWQAAFNFKSMFSRLPSFILIALLILVGIQLFFFGFLLQIIKDIKYRYY